VPAGADLPDCPACAAGQAMHPSFLYEIAFHLAAFGALLALRGRIEAPGELLKVYLLGYAVFRFGVEFVRGNEAVWLGLSRSQWFLLAVAPLLVIHCVRQYRNGVYDGVFRGRWRHEHRHGAWT
jgi:prolipoprotein diacylglyceryltransferase